MVSYFDYRHPDNSRPSRTLFIDPSSLGYAIQGVSMLDAFMNVSMPGDRLIVEADPRLIPLFQRSYQNEMVEFIPTNPEQREPLPNNGKPQTQEEMTAYYTNNARRLATRMNIADGYAWARLLRPEIAPPFDSVSPVKVPDPRPGYLLPDADEVSMWSNQFLGNQVPVLLTWNKGASQHGDAAQQNLDANDVAFIIRETASRNPLRVTFYNAMHGLSPQDYDAVNNQLNGHLRLNPIIDPKTGEDFKLGTELDRYAAFMSAAKQKGGLMLGVGNTYQHLWYAVAPASDKVDQIVVMPNGDFPTKPTWELQAAQKSSPTVTVSKYSDFDRNRTDTLLNVVAHARRALSL